MAIVDANHFRLQIDFLLNGNEQAQCGFFFMASNSTLPLPGAIDATLPTKSLSSGFYTATGTNGTLTSGWIGDPSGTSLQASDLAVIGDSAYTWVNANKGVFSSGIKATGVKITPYDQNRNAVAPAAIFDFTTDITGSGAVQHPWFMSWAVGWRGLLSGPSQRGRLYFPADGVSLTAATKAVGASAMTTMATGLNTLWQQMNDVQSARPVIVHRTSGVLPLSHVYNTYSDIAQLRINDQLDTMKTRGSSQTSTVNVTNIVW